MLRVRYNIVIQTSSHGVRKADFIWNKDPLRPGSIADQFKEAVDAQYEHLGFGIGVYTKLPKYWVRGLRIHVGEFDQVWMWCPSTKAAVVVRVVKHE